MEIKHAVAVKVKKNDYLQACENYKKRQESLINQANKEKASIEPTFMEKILGLNNELDKIESQIYRYETEKYEINAVIYDLKQVEDNQDIMVDLDTNSFIQMYKEK